MDRSHHIFLPSFGGLDDRAALRFVLQLAKNTNVTATIVQVSSAGTEIMGSNIKTDSIVGSKTHTTVNTTAAQYTHYEQERAFFASMRDSLPIEQQLWVLFDPMETTQA